MELAALEHLKKVLIDLKWFSGERSLAFGLLVILLGEAVTKTVYDSDQFVPF